MKDERSQPFWRLLLLLCVLALLPYALVVQNDAVFDSKFVLQSPRVQDLSGIGTIFSTEYWDLPGAPSRLYRPLTLLSIAFVSATVGNTAAMQHAMNALLHCFDVLLLFALVVLFARRLGIDEGRTRVAAIVTAAIAAVHPARSEAVIDIVGRGELLAFGFGMIALIAVMSRRRSLLWLAPIAAAAAVLSKESGLILPVFGALLLLAVEGRISRFVAGRTMLLALGVALAVGMREYVLRGIPNPAIEFGDNALGVEGAGARFLTGAAIAWRYVQLHLWPATLSPDYSFNAIPVRHGLDVPVLLGLAAIVGSLAFWLWSLRRGSIERGMGAALACLALGLLAIDNQIFLLGTMFGERLIYFAAWGGMLAFGMLAVRLWTSRRRIVVGAALPIIALLAIRTAVRVPEWKSSLSLFRAASEAQPESFRVWSGLGEALLREGRAEEAVAAFERSAAIHPGYPNNWSLWLSALLDLEAWDEIPRILSGLKIVRPDDVIGMYAEAMLLLRAGRPEEARAVAEAGRQRYAGYANLTRVAAEASVQAGDEERAIELFQELVDADPASQQDRSRLAFLQQSNECWTEAEANYQILLETRSDWYNANALAWSKRGRALAIPDTVQAAALLREALDLADRAAQIAPPENRRYVDDTRAKILEAMGDRAAAMEIYGALAASHPENEAYRAELERLRRQSR